jgi:hypothetical protein
MLSLSLGALCPSPAITFDGTIENPAAAVAVVARKFLRVNLLLFFII